MHLDLSSVKYVLHDGFGIPEMLQWPYARVKINDYPTRIRLRRPVMNLLEVPAGMNGVKIRLPIRLTELPRSRPWHIGDRCYIAVAYQNLSRGNQYQ